MRLFLQIGTIYQDWYNPPYNRSAHLIFLHQHAHQSDQNATRLMAEMQQWQQNDRETAL